MQRSSAICRRRWVSRMVNVLAMTMPATTRAITAKASSTVASTVVFPPSCAISVAACSDPVRTVNPAVAEPMAPANWAGSVPGSPSTATLTESPAPSAVIVEGRAKACSRAPESADDEVSAMPTTVAVTPPAPSQAASAMVLPTGRFAPEAVDRSTRISAGPTGQRPWARVNQRSRSTAGMLSRLIEPCDLAAVYSKFPAGNSSADATPGTARMAASAGPGCSPPSPGSTTTSARDDAAETVWARCWSKVAVNTTVAAANPMPSTMARPTATIRAG